MIREGISFFHNVYTSNQNFCQRKKTNFQHICKHPYSINFLEIVPGMRMLCGSARLHSRRRCFAGVLGWPGGLLRVAFRALESVSDDSQNFMTGCTVPPGLPRLRLVTWAGGGAGRRGAGFALFSV